jgi:hypothetical protein
LKAAGVSVVESPAQIGSSMLSVFKEKTLIWPRNWKP